MTNLHYGPAHSKSQPKQQKANEIDLDSYYAVTHGIQKCSLISLT
ncbi:uncharacterized protein METZ01_LOCUS258196 [marine metagenome]|uniref:Uncharacterized protein n=1 Tax=marine metagenome TaxID=408172 RepID=A0A382J1R1_9ZZZZ